jgi:hypothetical protein
MSKSADNILTLLSRRMDRFLLWPAVVVYAVLTALLAWAWFKPQENGSHQNWSHKHGAL